MYIVDIAVGFIAGILSGFGIGGGTLLILWLTLVTGMDQPHAGGINLLYFIFPAITSVIGHIKNKLVELRCLAFCVISGLPACIAASVSVAFLDVTMLRRGFGILLLFVGIKELFSKKGPETTASPSKK